MSYFSHPACWVCDDRGSPHYEVVNWAEKLFFMTITVHKDRKRMVLTKNQFEDSIKRNVPFQVCESHWPEMAKKLFSLLKMSSPVDSIDKQGGEQLLKLISIIDQKKKIKTLEFLEINVQQFTSQYWSMLNLPPDLLPTPDPRRHPKTVDERPLEPVPERRSKLKRKPEPIEVVELSDDDEDVQEIFPVNTSRASIRVQNNDEAGSSTSGPRPLKRRTVTFDVPKVEPEVQEDDQEDQDEMAGVQPRSIRRCQICQKTLYTKELAETSRFLALYLAFKSGRIENYEDAQKMQHGSVKRLFVCLKDLKKGAQALAKLLKTDEYPEIAEAPKHIKQRVHESMRHFATKDGIPPDRFLSVKDWVPRWKKFIRSYNYGHNSTPRPRSSSAPPPRSDKNRPSSAASKTSDEPPVRRSRREPPIREPSMPLMDTPRDSASFDYVRKSFAGFMASSNTPKTVQKSMKMADGRSKRYPAFSADPIVPIVKQKAKAPTPSPSGAPSSSGTQKPSIIRIFHPSEACGAGSSSASILSMPKVRTPPKPMKAQRPPPRVPKSTVPLPVVPAPAEAPPRSWLQALQERPPSPPPRAPDYNPHQHQEQEPGPSTSKSPSTSSVTSDAYHTPPETPKTSTSRPPTKPDLPKDHKNAR